MASNKFAPGKLGPLCPQRKKKFALGKLGQRVELPETNAQSRGGARPPRSSRHLRFAVFFC
ncbi:MAG: hypothetical protein FD139_2552, partial [Methylocystaceae bacterium]